MKTNDLRLEDVSGFRLRDTGGYFALDVMRINGDHEQIGDVSIRWSAFVVDALKDKWCMEIACMERQS